MTDLWFLQKRDDEWKFWSHSGGWGEMSEASPYTGIEKELIFESRAMVPGYFVPALECEACHGLRPDWGGSFKEGYFTSSMVEPPEGCWICAICAATRDWSEIERKQNV